MGDQTAAIRRLMLDGKEDQRKAMRWCCLKGEQRKRVLSLLRQKTPGLFGCPGILMRACQGNALPVSIPLFPYFHLSRHHLRDQMGQFLGQIFRGQVSQAHRVGQGIVEDLAPRGLGGFT